MVKALEFKTACKAHDIDVNLVILSLKRNGDCELTLSIGCGDEDRLAIISNVILVKVHKNLNGDFSTGNVVTCQISGLLGKFHITCYILALVITGFNYPTGGVFNLSLPVDGLVGVIVRSECVVNGTHIIPFSLLVNNLKALVGSLQGLGLALFIKVGELLICVSGI